MSGQNNQGEPAILLIMSCIVFGVLGWAFWYATHNFWVDHFFRWLRFGEIWIIHLFTNRYDGCLDWLHYAPMPVAGHPFPPAMMPLTNACFGSFMGRVAPQDLPNYYVMSMPPLKTLGAVVTSYIRWPMAVLLGGIVFYEMFMAPTNKFKVKHTLETFIQAQVKMWPIISPIVKFNPTKTGRIVGDLIPDKLPHFAEALTPEEWISWCRIPVVNGIPDRDAARRAFSQQLGPRWNGVDSLPLYIQALFAVFALRGAQKRDECDKLSGRLAQCWSPDTGFRMDGALTADVLKVVRDPAIGGKAAAIAEKFGWRTTAMLGVLRWARNNGGVLAPAQFLWVRAEDRALWYPLNNLGRRAYHSEGAGAMAHFMAEQAAQKPLPIPRVETAIVTLNAYLHSPEKKLVPIPPREGGAKA